jgi:hypothetical protein
MPDRLVDQPVLLAPDGGPPVQLRQPIALGPLQLGTEKIAEQLMEAKPAALLVQGDQEQVGALQFLQHVLAVGPAGDRVTERTSEPFQDRGLEQERPYPVGLALQDLLAQVVQDVAMGARERSKERIGVGAFAQRQGGQLQASRPPLRPVPQRGLSLWSQVEAPRLPQQGRRLFGGEPQVGCA